MALRKRSDASRRILRQKRSRRFLLEYLEPRVVLSGNPPPFDVNTEAGLREAISAADTNSLPTNTINITGSITLANTALGPLVIQNETDIPKTLTIEGLGSTPSATVLSGSSSWNSRLLEVMDPTGDGSESVNLNDLNFQGGHEEGTEAQGGAMMLDGEDLTLSDDIISGNTAQANAGSAGSGENGDDADGGAIYMESGQLTLDDSQIEDNKAIAGMGGSGACRSE